jgi:hypothetical protein
MAILLQLVPHAAVQGTRLHGSYAVNIESGDQWVPVPSPSWSSVEQSVWMTSRGLCDLLRPG